LARLPRDERAGAHAQGESVEEGGTGDVGDGFAAGPTGHQAPESLRRNVAHVVVRIELAAEHERHQILGVGPLLPPVWVVDQLRSLERVFGFIQEVVGGGHGPQSYGAPGPPRCPVAAVRGYNRCTMSPR